MVLPVWLLTALWHGLTPNFLIWGGVLWLCIVAERQLGRIPAVKRLKVLPHLYLWAVIPVTWMCFAITDLGQLGVCLGRMFGVLEGINVRSGDWIDALAVRPPVCGLLCRLYAGGAGALSAVEGLPAGGTASGGAVLGVRMADHRRGEESVYVFAFLTVRI